MVQSEGVTGIKQALTTDRSKRSKSYQRYTALVNYERPKRFTAFLGLVAYLLATRRDSQQAVA